MIRLHRPAVPAALQDTLVTLTDLIGAKATPRSRVTEARRLWKGRRAVHADLRVELARFAAGHDRCMYCGDNEGTDIDHYQPLALAPLLAFTWLNHLLACSRCNSHFKRDLFPVDAEGVPLILDPTRDDPFDHLVLSLSVGRYAPLTERGATTIDVCGLNRDTLTRGRQTAYDTMTLVLAQWGEAVAVSDATTMNMVVRTIREQPFADVCQAMLRYADAPGAVDVFADRPHLLPLLRSTSLRSTVLSA